MAQALLKEIEIGSKNALLKKRIITHYIYNGSSTITDLSKELDLSVPTVTKFITEMCPRIRLFYWSRHQKVCYQYSLNQF